MVIRTDQMQVFAEYMQRDFENRMVKHLRSAFPAKTSSMTEPELRGFVREGTGKAEQHGITDRNDISRYLELAMDLGPDFDGEPWAAEILDDDESVGTEKMDRLEDAALPAGEEEPLWLGIGAPLGR